MSNKERPEMTNSIDIDLDSIPHPKGCHPVPVGATIPPNTPFWVVDRWGAEWLPAGYATPVKIHKSNGLHLTIAPVAVPSAPPTPDDSPIIINHCRKRGALGALLKGLAVWTEDGGWLLVDGKGLDWWIDGDEIIDWAPAIVAKTGHGVLDERNKRSRVDADGDVWHWIRAQSVWACDADHNRTFGSLSAFLNIHGEHYLAGFADEEGGEE